MENASPRVTRHARAFLGGHLCPTSPLVLAVIVVVLDLQPLTGSAWNIVRSAIVIDPENVELQGEQ
jgi:hypothetical protein